MIVDDDEFILKLYTTKMREQGFEVLTLTTNPAALEKLRGGFNPDVLLLDIVMPGMDGIELLKNIRAEKLAAGAAVVMLSNQSQSADIEKAKALKIDGYIVKSNALPGEVVEEVMMILKKRKV